jgi:hypothetical protein
MKSDHKQASPSQGSADGMDLPGYVRLRTLLDSLECGAIRYFLRDPEGKAGRMNELNDMLMPIIDYVWEKDTKEPPAAGGGEEMELQEMVGCPEGYVDCHGVCVPYPCPD